MIDLGLIALVLPAVAAIATVALVNRRRHLTRTGTRRARKEAAAVASDAERRDHLAGAMRWWAVHDSLLAGRSTRALARLARLHGRLAHQLTDVVALAATAVPALDDFHLARRRSMESPPPHLSRQAVMAVNVATFTGDLMVTTMAITAGSPTASRPEALLSSLAIAACLFAVGKLLGKVLASRMLIAANGLRAAIGVAAVVVVLAVSLLLVRFGSVIAWLVLSICPVIGAAATVILGPGDVHRAERFRSRRWSTERRRLAAAVDRTGRTLERAAAAEALAAIGLSRNLTAEERAIGAGAGQVAVAGDLTADTTAIKNVLERMGVRLRSDAVDLAVGELAQLADQLRAPLGPPSRPSSWAPPAPDRPSPSEPSTLPTPDLEIDVRDLATASGSSNGSGPR